MHAKQKLTLREPHKQAVNINEIKNNSGDFKLLENYIKRMRKTFLILHATKIYFEKFNIFWRIIIINVFVVFVHQRLTQEL